MNYGNLAQRIEDAVGMLHDPNKSQWGFIFSCNALEYVGIDPHWVNKIEPKISYSLSAFGRFKTTQKQQQARALWLTFLAELAERGELTEEGLK